MEKTNELQGIIEATCELVKGAADPQRRTMAISPEVAALLQQVRNSQPSSRADRAASGPVSEDEFSGQLAELAEVVRGCTKCDLCKTRTQTVFGEGNPRAELVFVGEAPGAEEDWQGLPFVGPAGQMLNRIIENVLKRKRNDVYICNVLKCRPPENRDPRLDEIHQCEPYLIRQLELIRPKVICALGGHAAKTLLRTTESTGRLRGKWHFYHGIPVRVTYHPAYALRLQGNPKRFVEEKRKIFQDIQAVLRVLDGEEHPQPEGAESDLFS